MEEQKCFRIWLFGPLHVEQKQADAIWKEIPVKWERQADHLLCYLLCTPKRKAKRGVLIDALFPDSDNIQAEGYLRRTVHHLKPLFGDQAERYIFTYGGDARQCIGYALADSSVLWTDLDEVKACIKKATICGGVQDEALCWLEQVSIFLDRGEFLENESGEWSFPLYMDIQDSVNQCRQWLIEIYGQQGKFQQAREQIQKLLAANPDDEDIDQYCKTMRQYISRRSLLTSSLFSVPTILLANREKYEALSLQGSEDTLQLAWDAFYTSNAQRSVNLVEYWLACLQQEGKVTAIGESAVYIMRCRFLQLGSVLARDRGNFQLAYHLIHEAISLAFHLDTAELIASSLYRRAKIAAEQQRYPVAIQDLEGSLAYAKRSRSPLQSYIYVFLAEMYSLVIPSQKEYVQKSLRLLDSVDRKVRAYGVLDGDGSFLKVDVPGLYIVRGDVLRRFGAIDQSRQAVQIAKEALPKDFIRWRGNVFLSEAQLFFADGDVENGCKQLLNALDLFQANGSKSGRVKAHQVYHSLQQGEFTHPLLKEVAARLV